MKLDVIKQLADGLFFEPSDCVAWSPAHFNLKYRKEKTSCCGFNAELLNVSLVDTPNDAPQIVYFYDGTGNASTHLTEVLGLAELRAQVLLYDLPGFGAIDGSLSLSSYLKNSAQLFEHLCTSSKITQPALLCGDFIGSAAALNIASLYPGYVRGLVLNNLFSGYKSHLISRYGPGAGHLIYNFLMSQPADPAMQLASLNNIRTLVTYRPNGKIQKSEFLQIKRLCADAVSFIDLSDSRNAEDHSNVKKQITEMLYSSGDLSKDA